MSLVLIMHAAYRIVGNFRGVQFSRMDDLVGFYGIIFAGAHGFPVRARTNMLIL